MNFDKSVLEALLSTGSVKIEPDNLFTWTSGIKSPIYCDNRLMIGFVKEREQIVDGLVALIKDKFPDCNFVAGTATAGIPWAAFVAEKMRVGMVYVRSQAKAHGAGKQVEGFIPAGAKVVVVEDLISTGGSSMVSVNAIKAETDAEVLGIASIFSYGFQSSKNLFSDNGVSAFSLANFKVLLGLLVEQSKITEEQRLTLEKFSADPHNWLN